MNTSDGPCTPALKPIDGVNQSPKHRVPVAPQSGHIVTVKIKYKLSNKSNKRLDLSDYRQDTVEGQDDDMTPMNADGSLYSGSSTLPLVGDSIMGGASPEPGGASSPTGTAHQLNKPNGTLNSGQFYTEGRIDL